MGWNGDVTINDIVISGTSSDGLMVTTDSTTLGKGNITLHDVKSNKNGGNGAFLDNRIGANISVDKSTFGDASGDNRNGNNGLEAWSNGEITFTNVTADGNGNDGAYLNNASLDPTITNSQFNGNGGNGLEVYSNSSIDLESVEANWNNEQGAILNTTGPTYVDKNFMASSSFDHNQGNGSILNPAGLQVYGGGDIDIWNVDAQCNGKSGCSSSSVGTPTYGLMLDNTSGSGSISVDDSVFGQLDYNSGHGIEAFSNGAITLTDVVASNNGGDGAYLDNCQFDDGSGTCSNTSLSNITVDNGSGFNNNGANGLEIYSNGVVALSSINAETNNYEGAEVGAPLIDVLYCYFEGAFCGVGPIGGSVTVNDSDFSFNHDDYSQMMFSPSPAGLGVEALGDITLTGVSASDNGDVGAALDNSGCIFIFGCSGSGSIQVDVAPDGKYNYFNGNGINKGEGVGDGLDAFSLGEITLTDVTADYDYYDGADLSTGLDPTITNSHFDNNGEDGLYIDTSRNNADVTINCSTANGNGGYGLDGDLGSGTLTLNGVAFDSNNISSDILVINPGNCHGGGKSAVLGESGSLPWNVVNVPDSSGQGNPLSCSQYVGTELVLPNGDHILLPCPIGSTPGASGSLRGLSSNKLPGTALDSRFTFVSAFDVEVTPSLSGGMMTVSFAIPTGKQGANFAILHWDGTKWASLGGWINPPGYFSVTTSLTGDFVLVTQ